MAEQRRPLLAGWANRVSFGRIVILPVLWIAEWQGFYLLSLVLVVLIILSDIVDGMVARKLEQSDQRGAALDVSADFLFVFSTLLIFHINGLFRVLPWLLCLIAFTLYAVNSIRAGEVIRTRFGKYTGTLSYIAILAVAVSRLFEADWIDILIDVDYYFLLPVFAVSILENLFVLRGSLSKSA